MKKIYLAIIVLLIIAGFSFAPEYFNLQILKDSKANLLQRYEQMPLVFSALFFIAYVICTALSLPIASLLSLAAGAVFGLWKGTLLISFASSIGATAAFLMARYFFHEPMKQKFPTLTKKFQHKFNSEGNYYLLTTRLIPLFPFYVVNIVFALTDIKTRDYYLYSQLGMLPGTLIYINAGKELSQIDSLSGILSLPVIISLCLLGSFPLLAKKSLPCFNRLFKSA